MSEKKNYTVELYKDNNGKEECITVTLDRYTPNVRVKLKDVFAKLPQKPKILDYFLETMEKQDIEAKEKIKPLAELCRLYSENKISEEDFNKKYKYQELKTEIEKSNTELFEVFKENKFSYDMLMELKNAPKDSNGMPQLDFNLLWDNDEKDDILKVKLEAFRQIIKQNDAYAKNQELLESPIESEFWKNQDIEKIVEAVEFFRSKLKS